VPPITFIVFPVVRPPRNGAVQRASCCGSRGELLAALAEGAGADEHEFIRLLIVADVDDFRAYNARHGYDAGDDVLELLGRRLGEAGAAFHLGADTFAVLLAGTPGEVARRLALVLTRLTLEDPEPLPCSLGAALVVLEASGSGALALAEERLENQKRRELFLADRGRHLLGALDGPRRVPDHQREELQLLLRRPASRARARDVEDPEDVPVRVVEGNEDLVLALPRVRVAVGAELRDDPVPGLLGPVVLPGVDPVRPARWKRGSSSRSQISHPYVAPRSCRMSGSSPYAVPTTKSSQSWR
jgi:GGDEF domain-containing protein